MEDGPPKVWGTRACMVSTTVPKTLMLSKLDMKVIKKKVAEIDFSSDMDSKFPK